MRIIEAISDFEHLGAAKKGCVLTIGNFDGVHIGHQQVLTIARHIATEKKTELVILTFDPHPLAVLHPKKKPGILTPQPFKKHLLVALGVESRLVLKTTAENLSLSPADFVHKFLVQAVKPDIVVEGRDFNFGAARAGSIETLQSLAAENNFEVVVVEAKEIQISNGQTIRVSSTVIRQMLTSGEVADAALALGRPYRLMGQVTPGRGKGKRLGFPTLNMKTPDQLIPAEAVYAGCVEIARSDEELCRTTQKIPAVFSLGRTETYGTDQPLLIEAHLLAKQPDQFADKWLAMDFIQRIRGQRKFKTETELSAQIAKDCENAKQILVTNSMLGNDNQE